MRYYIIYKITNLNTNHYYIGMHSTSRIDDGYMGSGILIKKAIKHHGIENFKKEVLLFCKNKKDMSIQERKIINKDIVKDPNSYNLITGGKRRSKNTFTITARSKNCKELLNDRRKRVHKSSN